MLFDVRGRRRRVVQVVYLLLAVLIGGGLILFGIGSGASGGLIEGCQGGGSGGDDTFKKQVQTAEKQVNANPRNAAAWAALTRAQYNLAASGNNFDQNTGQFNDEGKKQLQKASQAWLKYLALKPKPPDPNLASLMAQAYGPQALSQPQEAVQVWEIITQARPSASAFFQLAVNAYLAKQTRIAELAAQKTVELTPAAQRKAVQQQLQQVKQQATGATGATGPGGAVPQSGGATP